ncbi:ribosome maturation factor RimP [Serpentinicella alkaliphila]|uniref:Ribosome maturation factor RimP n=1 Tax=Serpentinicella alkaliphila TaxID=1734049 RepID=A0A4V2T4P1_9FIRM|nr:ribosome maturation factor RimP [Serpentinicella alkaliphila]QUH26323.1 ribosome maturation factor RimP [Serpentinicella alkaliphila]TCQ05904.1 ribosome maturation factor RimP [Serpentinicella alkaliphila]
MGKNRVESIVEELVIPIVEKENFDLVDVEFKKEGPHKYLRVYIDKPEGISLDDCQKVSEQLSEKLDETDPIEENYFLEVSSPGLDRPLKRSEDYVKFAGREVEIKLYEPMDNKKLIEGELIELKDSVVKVRLENESILEIPLEKIALTRLAIKF